MQSHQVESHDLALAKKALAKVKAIVTSTNDIIPTLKLPFFVPAEVQKYIHQFGEETVERYLEYLKKLGNARANSKLLAKKYQSSLASPVTASVAAVGYSRVGECQELATVAMLELGLMGCKSPIASVCIASDKVNGSTGNNYAHNFLIIGATDSLDDETGLASFDSLPDECILLDPLLGIVGRANQFNVLLAEYNRLFAMNKITAIQDVDPAKTNFRQLEQDVLRIIRELEQMNKASADQMPDNVAMSYAAFFSASRSPEKQSMLRLCNACNQNARGDEILTALTKDPALSFRLACAYGSTELINAMLDGRQYLSNFALNIPSTKKPHTALDWLEHNELLSAAEKATLATTLRKAGCISYHELKTIKPK